MFTENFLEILFLSGEIDSVIKETDTDISAMGPKSAFLENMPPDVGLIDNFTDLLMKKIHVASHQRRQTLLSMHRDGDAMKVLASKLSNKFLSMYHKCNNLFKQKS